METIKNILISALSILGLCLLGSMLLSTVRVIDRKEAKCKPLYIDKLEPVVSTRWFCEIP